MYLILIIKKNKYKKAMTITTFPLLLALSHFSCLSADENILMHHLKCTDLNKCQFKKKRQHKTESKNVILAPFNQN